MDDLEKASRLKKLRSSLKSKECSIYRTLSVIGDDWTLLILREMFWGFSKFSDFQSNLKIPRASLVKRLNKLTDAKIILIQPYQEEGERTRQEYFLSPSGKDLLYVLVSLMQWGDKHLGQGPLQFVTRDKGEPVQLALVTEELKPVQASKIKVSRATQGSWVYE